MSSIINELAIPHLWLYTAPLFDGLVIRESSGTTRTLAKVESKGRSENQKQILTFKFPKYLAFTG